MAALKHEIATNAAKMSDSTSYERQRRPVQRQFLPDDGPLIAWPAAPLKLSGYKRYQRYEFDPTGTLLAPGGQVVWGKWRGQIYLELFALDLNDPQAIATFVNKFGALMVFFDWELLVGGMTNLLRLSNDTQDRIFEARRMVESAPATRKWHAARAGPDWFSTWTFGETIEEFRFGARVIRDLTRAWMYVAGHAEMHAPSWEALRYFDREPPDSNFWARWLLRLGLSHILRAVHPQIAIDYDGLGRNASGPLVAMSDGPKTHHGVGVVCALELFNHMLAQAAVKQCKFESCRRLFVFQDDQFGSGHPAAIRYKPRRDALFCSPQCRWAHMQRERRRRAAKRE